jgi:threonine synthase
VLDVMRRGGGGMVAVSDDVLLHAVATLARRAGVGAEPAGSRSGRTGGCHRTRPGGPTGTVVLLVTGGEVKAGGAPTDPGRVNLVEGLDEIERVLADDC